MAKPRPFKIALASSESKSGCWLLGISLRSGMQGVYQEWIKITKNSKKNQPTRMTQEGFFE